MLAKFARALQRLIEDRLGVWEILKFVQSRQSQVLSAIRIRRRVSYRRLVDQEPCFTHPDGDGTNVIWYCLPPHCLPAYVPIVRGILDICHAFATRAVRREELLDLYREHYRGQPFIQVYDCPREAGASWQYRPYPQVSAVAGTNYCQIGLDVDEQRGRIVVFSVLDSIGKGGAQAGVENMNLMFGLERTAGLARRGRHPN